MGSSATPQPTSYFHPHADDGVVSTMMMHTSSYDDEDGNDGGEALSGANDRICSSNSFESVWKAAADARPLLPKAAFFLGDLRDGLSMLNMQAAFLVSSKSYTEKQVGVLLLVFGLAQFLCMAPAGYVLDYSNHKIAWVIRAALVTSALTVVTTLTAPDSVDEPLNMGYMVLLKLIQGGVTAILTPGFNGITMGIVGSKGFTYQVSRNRMMTHVGTALVVAIGSLVAYFLYPKIGALFLVSPLAALGFYWNLRRIMPTHIDKDAARALIIESKTMTEYELADDVALAKQQAARIQSWNENRRSSSIPSLSSSSSSSRGLDQSSPYFRFPERPTPPPSEMAAPRRNNSVRNGNRSSQTSTPDHSTPYQPPDFLSSSGLEPPSTQSNRVRTSSGGMDPRTSLKNSDMDGTSPENAIPVGEDVEWTSDNRSPSQRSEYSGSSIPSFNLGLRGWPIPNGKAVPKVQTPLSAVLNPTLIVFCIVVFFFHMANASVLPLVMQSLALQDQQSGILLSGLCILIAQSFMAFFAKVCGDYSPYYGRKNLVLTGLAALTLRCFVLTFLASVEVGVDGRGQGSNFINICMLLTQFLDSVGAGIIGTMQILVTSDLSGGTGRFSLLLGVTTSAMCLGATISSYLGQEIAYVYGYAAAFAALGLLSFVPFLLYAIFMPETLPDYARPQTAKKRRKRLRELLQKMNEHRKSFLTKSASQLFGTGEEDVVNEAVAAAESPLTSPERLELV